MINVNKITILYNICSVCFQYMCTVCLHRMGYACCRLLVVVGNEPPDIVQEREGILALQRLEGAVEHSVGHCC